MLTQKQFTDYGINWFRFFQSAPWLVLTVLLVSIPLALLYNFSVVKQNATQLPFYDQGFTGDIKQIAISTKGNNTSAIEPYIADGISANTSYQVLYEKSHSVSTSLSNGVIQQVNASFISSAFQSLNWQAHLGELSAFFQSDIAQSNVVAISQHYWQKAFNQSPTIIGQTLVVNKQPLTIVAVLPEYLKSTRAHSELELMFPLSLYQKLTGNQADLIGPFDFSYLVSDNEMTDNVGQELTNFLLDEAYIFSDQSLSIAPAIGLKINEYLRIVYRIHVLTLLFVGLLIFCSLAFLATYLANANSRIEEFKIRALCGASESELHWQMVMESVLTALSLSLLTALVIVFSSQFVGPFIGLETTAVYLPSPSSLLLFLLLLTVSISALLVVVNLIQNRSFSVHIGRGASISLGLKIQGYVLMVFMCGISALSMFITFLLHHSLEELKQVDIGFATQDLSLITSPPPEGYKPEYLADKQNKLIFQYAEDTFGIGKFTSAMSPPFSERSSYSTWYTAEMKNIGNGQNTQIESDMVWPNYFTVMNTPLVRGRAFTWDNNFELVVSESLWQQYFHGQSLHNAKLLTPINNNSGYQAYRIVGVAKDIYTNGADQAPPHKVYSLLNINTGFESFLVRSALNEDSIKSQLQQVFNNIEQQGKQIELTNIHHLMQQRQQPMHQQFLISNLVTLLIITACFIFSFSVIAQIMHADSREISLKFSLGASISQLLLAEVRLFSVIATVLLLFSIGLLRAYSHSLSLLLHNKANFNDVYFVLFFIGLFVIITLFIWQRMLKIKQISWNFLT